MTNIVTPDKTSHFDILKTDSPRGGRRGIMIAIGSGKGGVGKTWCAITLSHALARAGQRVLLFDGDVGLANVDIQLGLLPGRDLGEVVFRNAPLQDVIETCGDGGFDVIAGRSGSGALAQLEEPTTIRLIEGLRDLTRIYDVIILDLAAGLDRVVRSLAAAADLFAVMTTDEPTSLTDAYAVLKLHALDRKTDTSRARIIVNLASSPGGGEKTYRALTKASQSFLGMKPPLAGIIRRDDRVREAIKRQALLITTYPTSVAAQDVEAIAARVLRTAMVARE